MIWNDLNIKSLDNCSDFEFYYELRKRFIEIAQGFGIKNVIYLPESSLYTEHIIYVSIDCDLNRLRKAEVLTGLFTHELGHSLYTHPPKEIILKSSNELYAGLFNLIEDERMERAMISFSLSKYFQSTKDYYFKDKKIESIEDFLLLYIRYPQAIGNEYPKFKVFLDSVFEIFPKTIKEVDIAVEKILKYFGNKKVNIKATDIARDAKKKAQKELLEAAKERRKEVFSKDSTQVTVFEDVSNDKEHKAEYGRIKEENIDSILKLRNIFKIRQRQVLHNKRGLYFGDFDNDEIVSAYIGQKNVYMNKKVHIANGFNLVLLIDLSGSMKGTNLYNAKIFSIIVYESLKLLRDVNLKILGHSTLSFSNSPTLIQRFYDYKLPKTPYSLAGIDALFENRDGAALDAIHKELREETDEEVILFMISDGIPEATLPEGQDDIEELRKAVNRAERDNIKIIHAAIEEIAYLPEVYKRSFLIYDFKELQKIFQKIVNEQF